MSNKPKWTPLERHNAQCSMEFCALHKAAPEMAEALQADLRVMNGALGYLRQLPPRERPDEDWFKPLEAWIAGTRAALRKAGLSEGDSDVD